MLTKRIYENLLWIREMQKAGGVDTKEIDSRIEEMRKELEKNPVAREGK